MRTFQFHVLQILDPNDPYEQARSVCFSFLLGFTKKKGCAKEGCRKMRPRSAPMSKAKGNQPSTAAGRA
jgi:hypothetical protein